MNWIQEIEQAVLIALKNAMPSIDRFTDEIDRQSDKQFYTMSLR